MRQLTVEAELRLWAKGGFGAKLSFIQSRARIIPITLPLALAAARIRREAQRNRPKFGLADAFHLATARQESAILVTSDRDFEGEEGILLL